MKAEFNQVATIVACVVASLLCANLAYSSGVRAEATPTGRVVAVGDIHGALDQVTGLLTNIGLIDSDARWIGGDTTLVSLGDLLDRGPDSRGVMDLLRRLQADAADQGGQVVVLLGNHELMNLTGDLRDVSAAEFDSYGGKAGHRELFAPDGEYGSWLLTLPAMAQVDGTLFVHGGVSSLLRGRGVSEVNAEFAASLRTLLVVGRQLQEFGVLPADIDFVYAADRIARSEPPFADALATSGERLPLLQKFIAAGRSELFGGDGPLWYRGSAVCHPLLEQPRLAATLEGLGARRIVVGHTPTARRMPARRQGGAAYAIDTGMLAAVYRGSAFALVIERSEGSEEADIYALDERGQRLGLVAEQDLSAKHGQLLARGELIPHGDEAGLFQINGAGGETTLPARFEKRSRRAVDRTLAALRIDRLLGLQMVPALARRELNGKQGILQESLQLITERKRREDNRVRPSYCETGADYLLLAAFDALIGKTDRGVDDLAFRRRDWRIVALENHRSFSTSSRLPAYASEPALPAGLAKRLAELDEALLVDVVGDLLKPREIKAILKRRDLILNWPIAP